MTGSNATRWRTTLIGAVLLTASWRVVLQTRPAAAKQANNYVDPAVCAGCHQEIARTYQLTGMGHSLYAPTPQNTIENYKSQNTVFNEPSGLTYTMMERDGKFYQRRSDSGEQEANAVEEQVDYVIGSGNHARSYLHRSPNGTLIELPVSWYTEKSGSWAMSPGYDRKGQEDFRRAITGECLLCHNGLPLQGSYPERGNTGLSVFPKEIPQGIDCQRCHGPGGEHARLALAAGTPREQIRQAIVNPARLPRDRQLEVCMQCHLETSSSLMPNEIRRYNRTIDSYRPGEPLGDYKIYFDRTATNGENDRFEIAHAGYRLRMSACFRATQMTCLTCHDPHQSYRTATSTARYLAVCQSCHQSVVHKTALPAGTDCLTCHMPKRRTDDVVHVVMTDHYIQRLAPDRDLLLPMAEADNGTQGADGIAPYYPSPLPQTGENELYTATAEVKHGAPGGIAHLETAIVRYQPSAPDFFFELGDGYARGGKDDEAIRWYKEALRRKPDYRPATKQLAAMLITKGEYARATEVLRQAIAAPPADEALFADLGNAYLRQHMLPQAQEALRRAIAINPEQPEAQNLLGLVAVQKGNPADAEAQFRGAIRSQPDFAEAHNNLGNVLAGARNFTEAENQFQRAIAIDPKYAEAHHSYALVLAINQSYDQAVAELREAIRLDPGNAQTRDDLGDILQAQGQGEGAADQYREAIRLKPGLADAHCSLGNLLGAQEKFDQAGSELQACSRLDPGRLDANLGLGMILVREGKTAEAKVQFRKALASPDPALHDAAQNALGLLNR